ncbi:MAG: hypothetical protein AAGF99_13700 [Bacteroidota bacterium]
MQVREGGRRDRSRSRRIPGASPAQLAPSTEDGRVYCLIDQTRSALGHDRIEQTADCLRAERGPLSQKDADRLAALVLSA